MKLKAIVLIVCLIFVPFIVDANPAHNAMMKESKAVRGKALAMSVASAGFPCVGVDTFFQGMSDEGAAFWNVSCTNGQKYVVQIMPDAGGSTRVLSCLIMEAINLKCFVRLDEQ